MLREAMVVVLGADFAVETMVDPSAASSRQPAQSRLAGAARVRRPSDVPRTAEPGR